MNEKIYTLNLKPKTFDIIYHDLRQKIQDQIEILNNTPKDLPHLRIDTQSEIDKRMNILDNLNRIDKKLNDPDPED